MKKGFTLLELLIVIGILAILSSVTVLVLNPAELLRQARDTQRINDLGAINNALALYSGTAATVALGTAGTRYTHAGITVDASSTAAFGASQCAGDTSTVSTSSDRTVLGAGWIPVVFGDISGGTPLAVLPVDPSSGIGSAAKINSWPLVYWFEGSTASSTWELAAKMESERYKDGGTNDVSTNDGGTCRYWYEIGTEPGLDF